jgi:hypothetical protein
LSKLVVSFLLVLIHSVLSLLTPILSGLRNDFTLVCGAESGDDIPTLYPNQSLGSLPSSSDLNTSKASVSTTPTPPINNNHPPIQHEVSKQKYALRLIGECITRIQSSPRFDLFTSSSSSTI